MNDHQIIQLYFDRSEEAITQTARKYGAYCHAIACRILRDPQDSEECVNDTYLKAWHTIPPQRPQKLAAYLGKLTRNLSIDRYRRSTAEKRGGSELTLALEELEFCMASSGDLSDGVALTDTLNRFLASLPIRHRRIFMRRYWYVSSIREIADAYGMSESGVKMSLLRSRAQLQTLLEQEGFTL